VGETRRKKVFGRVTWSTTPPIILHSAGALRNCRTIRSHPAQCLLQIQSPYQVWFFLEISAPEVIWLWKRC